MRTLTFVRTLVVVTSVTATAGTLALAQTQSPPPGAATAPPARAQPSATPPPAPSGMQQGQQGKSETGDIVQLIDQALSQVNLRPDQQQAIQGNASDVDAKVGAVDDARRDLLKALADQIESGHVDENALQPQTQKFVTAADDAAPAVRGAIQKLHDTLDSQQRKQFADALRSEIEQGSSARGAEATLNEWASRLHLSADQKQKIRQILSADTSVTSDAHDRVSKLLDAFPSDQFQIDQVVPAQGEQGRAEAIAKRIEDVAGQVTDVLTPDQRKTAADAIRAQVSGQMTQGPSGGMGQTQSGLEAADTTTEELWAGRSFGVGRSSSTFYHRSSGYGFSTGMAGGYGGMYFF